MAACYLKLEDWKAAVDAATASLDRLDKMLPSEPKEPTTKKADTETTDAVVEITGDDEATEQEELTRLKKEDERKADILRIRAKALMRRARAKSLLGGWGNLQGAEEDYKVLAAMENLPADERRIVQKALRELPARIGQAREKEMGEMMGKLKDVSDAIPVSSLLD